MTQWWLRIAYDKVINVILKNRSDKGGKMAAARLSLFENCSGQGS